VRKHLIVFVLASALAGRAGADIDNAMQVLDDRLQRIAGHWFSSVSRAA